MMADTLQELAGAAWSATDVIARFRPVIPAEQAVLASYVFLPYARSGIAAALTEPFAWTAGARASVVMRVPVIDARGEQPAEMTVNVYGPADVTEIDTRQVIRTWPKADAHDTEIDDLVQVEFDRPELPWLFTPTGPDGSGRLVPWLTLVVAREGTLSWGPARGSTRAASIRRDQLQPLDDAYAWAHAQVMGTQDAGPSLEDRLSGENAPFNLSRLLCPRRLEPFTAYTACVVPTFLAGARAGLGLTPVDRLTPAWGPEPADTMIDLPVYYAWRFATGEAGNFESLARKIRSQPAPPGVGRRRLDATRPWSDAGLTAADPGAEMIVKGPIVSPANPADDATDTWPTEEQQRWAEPVTEALRDRLNRADEQEHADTGDDPPLVTPPLYGGTHRKQPRIEPAEAADSQPPWFRELNLDPRHRTVGGLGTRVVQAEQEDLMLSAWNQVIGVEAANRALRLAQLAKHVAASLHQRHLAALSAAEVLAATERVHGKVLDAPGVTVLARVAASSLPPAAVTGAFRRLVRSQGHLARIGVRAVGRGGVDAATRIRAVDRLTVADDLQTTDWVLRYVAPDGIDRFSAAAQARVTDLIATRLVPGADAATLLAQWRKLAGEPGPEERLGAQAVAGARFEDTDLGGSVLAAILARLVAVAPGWEEMFADENLAVAGFVNAGQLAEFSWRAGSAQLYTVDLPLPDIKRLDLPLDDHRERTGVVPTEPLHAWARTRMDEIRERFGDTPLPDAELDAGRLGEALAEQLRVSGERLAVGFARIADKLIVDDPFAEADRPRIDAPGLQLVAKLNPLVTVPARVDARLTGGTGRLPDWLRPGWFADRRIEPVMTHPRFDWPMYEPLHRYDPDWMIPGLGRIERPDMATLLQTNNTFIEGYLVGLNHEMGRELLWREYPTDQRGTYFRSFWTHQPELAADLHEPAWGTGSLGDHLTMPDGRIVLLVRGDLIRRYPGVVAHAVRQAQGPDGAFSDDAGVPLFEAASPTHPVKTLFRIVLPPNILLVGFDLERDQVQTELVRWWFTLAENPTEPRFGLDPALSDPPPVPLGRDDLIWADFGVALGGFLNAADGRNIAFPDQRNVECRWGRSSAEVAMLLFQLPGRAAYNGVKMLAGAG